MSELRHNGRKVRDQNSKEREAITEYAETNHYLETLDILFRESRISDEQRDIGIKQYNELKSAGLADYIEFMLPDMLSYLIRSLGYKYPSNQKIQDELFKYFMAKGILRYKHSKQLQIDKLMAKLGKLLSDLP